MDAESLLTLLDQVELACGEEIAGPLRRAVRERDGALGMLGDDMPIEALRAVAEWAGEHPSVLVRLINYGGNATTVQLERATAGVRHGAGCTWSIIELHRVRRVRDMVRGDLVAALRQIEAGERAASGAGRFPPGIESATVTFGGVTVPVQSLTV